MELANEFVVTAPVDAAWAILTDLERIAPCLPGAQLEEVEGDEYRGTVRVKVGPITSQYKGTASFVELDEENHRAVLRATGRDTRGQGNAMATVTATLTPDEGTTKVNVTTELDISGKVAQFGRGMLADISTKLLGQFAERLEADVVSALHGAGDAEASETTAPSESADGEAPQSDGVRQVEPVENPPADLGRLVGPSLLKAIPIVGVVALAVVKIVRRRAKRDVVEEDD